ncbi:MAG: prepilin-type N-terminal cleavage/methylation domain-containing protein [Planctomycetota bacterium]
MIRLMRCAPTSRQQAGYTIAEMLVVVAVLSIISALAVPMFRGQDATQLREAAKLLAADLDAAKVESMTHADDLRLVLFDTTNHTYHIAAASDPNTPITNPMGRQPYLVDFGQGRAAALSLVQIHSVDLDGDDELGFGLYGQLDQATPATITLAANDARLTLTLDPATGEATIGEIE